MTLPFRTKITGFLLLYLLAGGWSSVLWCGQAKGQTHEPSVLSGTSSEAPEFFPASEDRNENDRVCLKLPPARATTSPSAEISDNMPPAQATLTTRASSLCIVRGRSGMPPHQSAFPDPRLLHLRSVVLLN